MGQGEWKNNMERLVKTRIEDLGISPNENLGQHFLLDEEIINLLARSVTPGNTVIEIGAGVGQLTEVLAKRAGKVLSIEIDGRFEPVLTKVTRDYPNVQIIFGNALTLKYADLISRQEEAGMQIVANLPFHITEPFLHKIAGLPIESATLVVGERLASAIQASSETSLNFGQLTLLVQTFFDIDALSMVEKQKSFPAPRTDSVVIRLIPKEELEFRTQKRLFLFRRLFVTRRRNPLVKNCLKEGIIEFTQASQIGTLSKREYHRRTRSTVRADLRKIVTDYNINGGYAGIEESESESVSHLTQSQARAIIEKMSIPEAILDKPFEQLNNNELKILSQALRL